MDKINVVLDKIHSTKKVQDAEGNTYDLHSAISKKEGLFIFEMIKKYNCKTSVEIGCAYGVSSLYICSALQDGQSKKDYHHKILDPYQNMHWKGVGEANLKKAGVDFYDLITDRSEFILPKLLQEGQKFDLAFIDGCHTLDHTLLDIFYCNRLLKVGGIIIIDDVLLKPVNKAVRYLSNYPCYKKVGGAKVDKKLWKLYNIIMRGINLFSYLVPLRKHIFSPEVINYSKFKEMNSDTMIAFEKISEDNRRWDWYEPF